MNRHLTGTGVCVACEGSGVLDNGKSWSVVSDSVTPWTIACQTPLSMGILQARILELVAISFSRQWEDMCKSRQISCNG